LTDLAATVTQLAGLEGTASFPGSSLSRFWKRSDLGKNEVITSVRLQTPRGQARESELRSVITDDLHYILSDIQREALFRYRADPLEQADLLEADSLDVSTFRTLRARLWADGAWLVTPDRMAGTRTGSARQPPPKTPSGLH
jgi:hypothetical protein